MDEGKRMELRYLVKARYSIQKTRIQMDNRLSKKRDGEDQSKVNEHLVYDIVPGMVDVKNGLVDMEKELEHLISASLKGIPVYEEYLKNVDGVGKMTAAVIISEIDIAKAHSVAALWQFCGFNPGLHRACASSPDGKDIQIRCDRPTKGYMIPYNKFLKTKLIKVLSDSFIRHGSSYRSIYDKTREELDNSDRIVSGKTTPWKDEPKGHKDAYARRKMIKAFLKDLWLNWRLVDGLPLSEPYRVKDAI